MISLPPITVPATLGAISTGQSLLALDGSSALSLQLDGAPGDACAIYGANIGPTIASVAQARFLWDLTGETPIQFSPPPFPYLYAVRTSISGAPTTLPLLITGQETAGTAGGGGGGVTSLTAVSPVAVSAATGAVTVSLDATPILQGGQALGADMLIGTTDAKSFEIQTDGVPAFGITSVGMVNIGSGGSNNKKINLLPGTNGGAIDLAGPVVAFPTTVGDPTTPTTADPIPAGVVDAVSFLWVTTAQNLPITGIPYLRLLPAPVLATKGRLLIVMSDPDNPSPIAFADQNLYSASTPNSVALAPGQMMTWSWSTTNNAWQPSFTQYPVKSPGLLTGAVAPVRLNNLTVYQASLSGGPPTTITPSTAGAFPGDIMRFIVSGNSNPVAIVLLDVTVTVNALSGHQSATVDIIFERAAPAAPKWVLLASSVPVA